jgi:hypothetical protein
VERNYSGGEPAKTAPRPPDHWATTKPVAVTLYYFPAEEMEGDIGNIAKFILDALKAHIYIDDHQVDRIVIQKFEPDRLFSFTAPSAELTDAMLGEKPALYVRISTDPFEELA